MLDLEGIGKYIKILRIESSFSQDELASKLLVSRQAISSWEIGKAIPTIDNIVELSKIFNIPIDKLLLLEDSLSIEEYFNYHSKNYIYSVLINGNYKFDLIDNFYRFDKESRYSLIRLIIDKRIKNIDLNRLDKYLTNEEKAMLKKRIGGGK